MRKYGQWVADHFFWAENTYSWREDRENRQFTIMSLSEHFPKISPSLLIKLCLRNGVSEVVYVECQRCHWTIQNNLAGKCIGIVYMIQAMISRTPLN